MIVYECLTPRHSAGVSDETACFSATAILQRCGSQDMPREHIISTAIVL